jgi:hypothetical protein
MKTMVISLAVSIYMLQIYVANRFLPERVTKEAMAVAFITETGQPELFYKC